MYNSCIRIPSNKGIRHKPRLLEGNIQGIFACAHADDIGLQWTY